MERHERRKSEAKRTTVLFALPLLVLGAVPASKFYKEKVKQRRTQALLEYAPITSCDNSGGGYSSDGGPHADQVNPGIPDIPFDNSRCYDEQVSWLIENGADVNARNQRGLPLIRVCAENEQWEIVRLLQRAGARADAETKRLLRLEDARGNDQSLERAVASGDLAWVKKAVAQGADVNPDVDDKMSDAPLAIAIYTQNVPIAEYLIAHGASLRVRHDNTSAQSLALRYCEDLSMVRTLKRAGAPTTPALEMIIAVDEDRPRDVEKYLRAGVGVNSANNNGAGKEKWTPLMWAARNGNVRMVRLLLKHDANPSLRDGAERRALDIAHSYTTPSRAHMYKEAIALLKRATRS